MKVKNEERIARLEAICDKMRSEELDVQKKAYEDACAAEDEELAAALANAYAEAIEAFTDEENKLRCDKAVAQIRKASGLDAKPVRNNYVALKRKRKSVDSASEADIGKRIMEKRNPNYKK